MKNSMDCKICKSLPLLWLGLLLFSLVAFYGCATKKNLEEEIAALKEQTKKVRAKQADVAKRGGHVCGYKELAIAESNTAFANYELAEANYLLMKEHLAKAKKYASLAYIKADACEPPDRDKDMILDSKDKCIDDPEDKDGFEDEDGCPDLDNDKDGLKDKVDKCPDDAEDKDGFQDEDGCPDPDNDQDKLPDEKDRCPNDAEDFDKFQDEDGCPEPDNDQDGILDDKDKCPNEAEVFNGVKDADGCPDEDKYKLINVSNTQIELKQKIFFATNRARIQRRSYPLLNEIAVALKDNPSLKVEIGGHTDNVGKASYNKKLSQKRAEAVRDYLIEKGGVNGARLTAIGYGQDKPIASNRTARGRDKNRRVEFKIQK